jgi:hypothetical protein
MGMEHDPNILSRQPDLRASDADRAQIIELLRRHHQDGRLTAEELAERIERVNAATTVAASDAVHRDNTRTDARGGQANVLSCPLRLRGDQPVPHWYLGVQWPWSVLADLGDAWVGTGHGVLCVLGLRSPRRPEPVSDLIRY